MIYENGAVGGMRTGWGNRCTRRKPAPLPASLPTTNFTYPDLRSNPGRHSRKHYLTWISRIKWQLSVTEPLLKGREAVHVSWQLYWQLLPRCRQPPLSLSLYKQKTWTEHVQQPSDLSDRSRLSAFLWQVNLNLCHLSAFFATMALPMFYTVTT